MQEMEFDVAVIGSGPAGYVAGIRASQLGLKTCLIEKEENFGGVCLNKGCIPTKFLLNLASTIKKIKNAHKIGINVSQPALDLQKAQSVKKRIIRKLSDGIKYLLNKNKVNVIKGFGILKDEKTIETLQSGQQIRAKNIILATGSHPKSLPHLKIDEKTIISSDTALEITSLPKSLLIIGAGPIGVEFASIFSSLGTKTILVEIMPQILPQEDEDAANELQRCLKKQGITIFTSSEVISCQNGIAKVKQKDGTVREVEYEKILMAVGRGPNINNIGIEKVGIELKDGFIKVNEWMQTNIKTIYAIGDILKSPQLAHVGSAEGILCAEKIAGKETTPPNYDTMPSCTYSFPQVARVGLTEKQAREVCRNLKSAKYPFSASPMASVTGNTEGFVKIISDSKTGEVLGVHIVHELATELISQGGLVLSGRLKVNDIINTVIPHPTLSEAILETARQIYNIAINF